MCSCVCCVRALWLVGSVGDLRYPRIWFVVCMPLLYSLCIAQSKGVYALTSAGLVVFAIIVVVVAVDCCLSDSVPPGGPSPLTD